MIYGDEEIIKRRVAAQNAKRRSITNDVIIEGVLHRFGERGFPPYFSMVLPAAFEEMPKAYAEMKHPYENRPQTILSVPDTTVGVNFNLMEPQPLNPDSRLMEYKAVIKRLHPGYAFFSESAEETESGLKVCVFDYQGAAVDGDIYYMNFFFDLEEGEMFGGFNCPAEQRDGWESLVRQMIMTIEPWPRG